MKTDPEKTSVKGSQWQGIKRRSKKVLNWSIAVIVVIAFIFIYWQYFYTYSSGYRAGLLQKFSYKGNVFKTYEGEMILSSVSGNPNNVIASEKFYFSVTDRDLALKLDTSQGRMVIVHYREKKAALRWHGDTRYIVDSVKRIRN